MNNLEATPLMTLNGETVSLEQAFSYLRLFGQFQPFIRNLLQFHILYKEIQANPSLTVTTTELGQAILDFRVRNDLTDPGAFGNWMNRQGMDYPTLESQVVVELKLEKLKQQLLGSQIEQYWAEHAQEFDYIDIAYVLAINEEDAHKIKGELDAGASFDTVNRHYPLNAEQTVLVKRDLLRRNKLREDIKTAMAEGVKSGTLLGPIPMGSRWCVFRLEGVLSAELDDALRQELKPLFFDQWIAEKLSQLQVGPFATSPQSASTNPFEGSAESGPEQPEGNTEPGVGQEIPELQPV